MVNSLKAALGWTMLLVLVVGMVTHPFYTFTVLALVQGVVYRHKIVCKLRGSHKMDYYRHVCKCGHKRTGAQ